MGSSEVACWSAGSAAPVATITSTLTRTSSAAKLEKRPACPRPRAARSRSARRRCSRARAIRAQERGRGRRPGLGPDQVGGRRKT